MDSNQNNTNPFNPTPTSPLNPTPGGMPSAGFDLSQTSPANPTPIHPTVAATPMSTPSPMVTPDTNFTPSLSTPTDNGGLSFPSKSPWDSSPSVTPSSPTPLDNSVAPASPIDMSAMSQTQSPSPLSLPTDNQAVSLTSPTTNISATPPPVDFSSLTPSSSLGQTASPMSPTPSPVESAPSPSTTSWSPQSMDSTQSVPVNPQSSQPMTDSSVLGGASLPPSGSNLSDQTNNNFGMPSQGSTPSLSPTPDFVMPTSTAPMMDTNANPSPMSMPTTNGETDGGSVPSWPTPPTDPTMGSSPTAPSVDSSTQSSSMPNSNPFGMDAAPTDLSHLVDGSSPSMGTPSVTVAGNGNSQTGFEPASSNQSGLPTASANVPTASISGEGSSSGFPKAIIFLVIGVLLIVGAAVAYFILGVGKSSPANTSVPLEQQQLTTPPAAPTTVPAPTKSASGSGNLTITPPAASSSSASTSAIDLLR